MDERHKKRVLELHKQIQELRTELKEHAQETDNAQCAALCETSAEVLGGIESSFDHFINRDEEAWQWSDTVGM